jgi:hypothetical protein
MWLLLTGTPAVLADFTVAVASDLAVLAVLRSIDAIAGDVRDQPARGQAPPTTERR